MASSSDDSDYLPEDTVLQPRPPSLSQLVQKEDKAEWGEGLQREWKRRGKLRAAGRSNSARLQVRLEDIRSAQVSHIRKSSCRCEVCGGAKLATLQQMMLIPKSEIVPPPTPITGVRTFTAFLRGFHREGMIGFPGLLSFTKPRKQKLTAIYTKPPETPNLRRYLATVDFPRKCATARYTSRRTTGFRTSPPTQPCSPLALSRCTTPRYTDSKPMQHFLRLKVKERLYALQKERAEKDELSAAKKGVGKHRRVLAGVRPRTVAQRSSPSTPFPIRPG